ncbi:MAG: PhnE/PtxC family ABC transporter permease, partial [Akkermansiaceae bacterium]
SQQARDQLIASGASPLQAFFTALMPQAIPDMATYTLYRFECALRSSAVLGFIGIETIGLSIKKSFYENFYNELWTELYLLLIVILAVDLLGAALRKRLNSIPERKKPLPANPSIKELQKSAPKWKLTRVLLWSTLALVLVSWFPRITNIDASPLLKERAYGKSHSERMEIFVKKLTPAPVKASHNWNDALPWAKNLWLEHGKEALINTVALASAAIVLSAIAAWFFLPWASRALAKAHPLGMFGGQRRGLGKLLWKIIGMGSRGLFIVTRAIPEYIYAFLLIGLLGLSAWPLVIALALHNFGILGRLWGEVMENQSTTNAQQILQSGGTRWQGYLSSYMPESFNRFLMYLFYRWETCVREATVLGMLGFASLGLHIDLARNFSREYDAMLFYVLLGAAVVFIGDFISIFIRRGLRKA